MARGRGVEPSKLVRDLVETLFDQKEIALKLQLLARKHGALKGKSCGGIRNCVTSRK
jgi:hypothetical protein